MMLARVGQWVLDDAPRFRAFAVILLIWIGWQVSPVSAARISVEGDCALAQAIESANGDRAIGGCAAGDGEDRIELAGDIALSAELPVIESAIAIEGGGHAISGDQRFRIFYVAEGGDLSISNLTMRDGSATEDARVCIDWEDSDYTAGGAICNLGALNVTDSQFSGNGSQFGGAIASVGTVTVDGSEFSGNTANSGGAVFNWGEGALRVSGSVISDNSANIDFELAQEFLDTYEDDDREFGAAPIIYNGNGGAIANSLAGSIIVSESEFSGNDAGLGAGAIVSHGDLEIIASEFKENSTGGSGGAINSYLGAISIRGSVFSGNSAGLGGAVVSWGKFEISDSSFSDNSAARGGAIHITDSTDLGVSGGDFSENTASDSGGAIFIFGKGKLSVADSQFSSNFANIRGGAIFSYGAVTVRASQFRLNQAGDLGGGLMNGGALSVVGSEFYGNSASEGGAIYNEWDWQGVVEQEGNSYSDNIGGDCVGCG